MSDGKWRGYRQAITDAIIDALKSGVAPWQKPWDTPPMSVPYNAATGRQYNGFNRLMLLMHALDKGSADMRFCTYLQAQKNGWQVKRGEKGIRIEYWKYGTWEEETNEETGETTRRFVAIHPPSVFYRWVFHVSQMDGVPPIEHARPSWDPIGAAEELVGRSGARIIELGDRAFYNYSKDVITMPPRAAFRGPEQYYGTLLHEMVHWTGHSSRLNRNFAGSIGDEDRAREELRAEIGSMFLSAELGIECNARNHASYVESWIKVLQKDHHEIFRAARDAGIAADMLMSFVPELRVHLSPGPADEIGEGPGLGEEVEDSQPGTLEAARKERLDPGVESI